MSVEVREVTDEPDTWNRCVDRSPQSCLFHRLEFLRLLSEHSGMELRLLAGFKGEEPVGGFPLFITSKGPASILYSPPPNLGVAYLGPFLLNTAKLKQRKFERRHKSFVSQSLDWIRDEIDPKYIHARTPVGYDDPRPFQWEGVRSDPQFTYLLDLGRTEEEIKDQFSKSLRRYLGPQDKSVEISVGGTTEIEHIYRHIADRYEAQDRTYQLSLSYLEDVYTTLPEEMVRPYVGRADGEIVAGILLLRDETTCYFWQGGGKPDTSVPINDLLHWRIIRDGISDELRYYDLYGANTERICEYKSKFNSGIAPYYHLEQDTLISRVYKAIR